MSQISIVGLDLAKLVFQVHGADEAGRCLLRKQLKRRGLLPFFAGLTPRIVAMEACDSAHFWAREMAKLGHEARLILPAYVKPYVKRGKSDRIDAEAICEAASRPAMRFVPIKSMEQQSLTTPRPLARASDQDPDHAGECAARPFGRVRFRGGKGIGKLPDLIKIEGKGCVLNIEIEVLGNF